MPLDSLDCSSNSTKLVSSGGKIFKFKFLPKSTEFPHRHTHLLRENIEDVISVCINNGEHLIGKTLDTDYLSVNVDSEKWGAHNQLKFMQHGQELKAHPQTYILTYTVKDTSQDALHTKEISYEEESTEWLGRHHNGTQDHTINCRSKGQQTKSKSSKKTTSSTEKASRDTPTTQRMNCKGTGGEESPSGDDDIVQNNRYFSLKTTNVKEIAEEKRRYNQATKKRKLSDTSERDEIDEELNTTFHPSSVSDPKTSNKTSDLHTPGGAPKRRIWTPRRIRIPSRKHIRETPRKMVAELSTPSQEETMKTSPEIPRGEIVRRYTETNDNKTRNNKCRKKDTQQKDTNHSTPQVLRKVVHPRETQQVPSRSRDIAPKQRATSIPGTRLQEAITVGESSTTGSLEPHHHRKTVITRKLFPIGNENHQSKITTNEILNRKTQENIQTFDPENDYQPGGMMREIDIQAVTSNDGLMELASSVESLTQNEMAEEMELSQIAEMDDESLLDDDSPQKGILSKTVGFLLTPFKRILH